jgi:hypothetical protein
MKTRSNRRLPQKSKSYNTPNDCWHDEDFPQNQRFFLNRRQCRSAAQYHENECSKFDDALEDIGGPQYRSKLLNFYDKWMSADENAKVRTLDVKNHRYGEIDILRVDMPKSHIKILKNMKLEKRDIEKIKQKDRPSSYSNWPERFSYIDSNDTPVVRRRKMKHLSHCIARRVTFMNDCVYDCSENIVSRYLKIHLDFILKLQILKARFS